jgi:hypothetical protein
MTIWKPTAPALPEAPASAIPTAAKTFAGGTHPPCAAEPGMRRAHAAGRPMRRGDFHHRCMANGHLPASPASHPPER